MKVDQVVELLFLARGVELGVDGPQARLHDDHDVRQSVANLEKCGIFDNRSSISFDHWNELWSEFARFDSTLNEEKNGDTND